MKGDSNMTQETFNPTNTNDAFLRAGQYQPDLSASIVTEKDGEAVWTKYFTVDVVADGYFKGLDMDGETIIVQTREANDAQQDTDKPNSSSKRRPDLFVYREDETEDGTVWTEIFVAWKGKKNGYFTASNSDGNDIVIQTNESREAMFNEHSTKQINPVDFEKLGKPETA
jgi:hypothetical protein